MNESIFFRDRVEIVFQLLNLGGRQIKLRRLHVAGFQAAHFERLFEIRHIAAAAQRAAILDADMLKLVGALVIADNKMPVGSLMNQRAYSCIC